MVTLQIIDINKLEVNLIASSQTDAICSMIEDRRVTYSEIHPSLGIKMTAILHTQYVKQGYSVRYHIVHQRKR